MTRIRDIIIPLTFLLVGTTCLWRGFHSPPQESRTIETRPVALEATTSPATATKPIETIRVGERVWVEANPTGELDLEFGSDVVPHEWQKMVLRCPTHGGGTARVEMLRPKW